MRASLYLIGFAAASIVGAGAAEIGCSSSSSGSPNSPEDAATPGDTGTLADTGSTEDAGSDAAPCVPLDASAATIQTGTSSWNCFEQMCATTLTACAADCQCNDDVLGALQCIATDAGSNIACFAPVSGSSDPADIAFLGCLVPMESACMVSDAGTIIGDGSTPGTDAAPDAAHTGDAGDGG